VISRNHQTDARRASETRNPMATKTRRASVKAATRTRKTPGKSGARKVTTAKTLYPIPATMKAAAIDKFGPPEVLTLHTLPVPKISPKEVLIALRGAGLGVWDTESRKGNYKDGKEKFPLVLGSDGAGIVVQVGKDVRRFKPGDEVWAYEFGNKKGGFYAEYVAVKADSVRSTPKELTLIEASAAPATGLTALQGVDDHLKLRKTETILVFGATGAVGTLAVQFAKRTGAHVVATASTPDGERVLRELGINDVFDSRAADASERLRSFAPNGLNAVLALAGGDTLERCIDQLARGGRVAYPNGAAEPRKRAKVRIIAYDGEGGPAEFERLNRAVTESRLRVVIADKFRLEDAAKAHARVEQGHVVGRVVLQIV
jgi:NADPH2:quinone reductase